MKNPEKQLHRADDRGAFHWRRRKSIAAHGLMLLMLLLWQWVAMGVNASYILPSPLQIVKRLWELRDPLFRAHLPATMEVVAVSLLISVLLGIGLAVLMDLSAPAEQALYPLIIASQTVPITALAPLFVLWFGYSLWSKVLVSVLMSFFPITITLFDGFRAVQTESKELMLSFGASPAQIFWKLKVPAVLPYFFSSIRMAIPISVIGAAIGEWLGAQSGLGYFSRRMMTQLDGAAVFAPILLLSAAAMGMVAVVRLIERRVLRWCA